MEEGDNYIQLSNHIQMAFYWIRKKCLSLEYETVEERVREDAPDHSFLQYRGISSSRDACYPQINGVRSLFLQQRHLNIEMVVSLCIYDCTYCEVKFISMKIVRDTSPKSSANYRIILPSSPAVSRRDESAC